MAHASAITGQQNQTADQIRRHVQPNGNHPRPSLSTQSLLQILNLGQPDYLNQNNGGPGESGMISKAEQHANQTMNHVNQGRAGSLVQQGVQWITNWVNHLQRYISDHPVKTLVARVQRATGMG